MQILQSDNSLFHKLQSKLLNPVYFENRSFSSSGSRCFLTHRRSRFGEGSSINLMLEISNSTNQFSWTVGEKKGFFLPFFDTQVSRVALYFDSNDRTLYQFSKVTRDFVGWVKRQCNPTKAYECWVSYLNPTYIFLRLSI